MPFTIELGVSAHRRAFVASTLQRRIEQSLRSRALAPGDRLPSTREVGGEFDVDPRVALAAYQTLAEEGLVVLKPRSGVYVAPATSLSDERPPSGDFLADTLVAAVVRGFSLSRFTDDLRIAALGRRLRATVIAATVDQAHGLSRELRVDYGFETTTLLPEELKERASVRSAIQRAHLVITTKLSEKEASAVAEPLGKQVMVVDIRPPFLEKEWKDLFRSGRAYIVAADPRFLEIAQSYLGKVMDLRNVRTMIAGRDDLTAIPPQAPTYVTEAARQKLGKFRIPGRLISPPRLLAENSVRSLVAFIVKMNLEQAQE
ncbi:MAG: GntR family transcriptional regulator [Gemmatimonadota bacterium]|nr:GntR family transcriptional regulator [Gemmatimonadota bacterium]